MLLRSGRAVGKRIRSALLIAVPGLVLLALWWWYVALTVPTSPTDSAGIQAFSPPLAGWAQVLGRIAAGGYVADAPVGPFGPAAMAGMLALLVAAVVMSLRLRTLSDWTGLLLGCYGLAISGVLLGRFLSATRALAPCVLGAGLAVLTVGVRRLGSRRAADPAVTTPSR
jgi:hypothetical protein